MHEFTCIGLTLLGEQFKIFKYWVTKAEIAGIKFDWEFESSEDNYFHVDIFNCYRNGLTPASLVELSGLLSSALR